MKNSTCCAWLLGLFFNSHISFGLAQTVEILLPRYPPLYTFIRPDGSAPSNAAIYRYKDLQVKIDVDPSSETGFLIPMTLCEFSESFSAMLPEEFATVLLDHPTEIATYGGLPDYREVSERLRDVAHFVRDAWGLNRDSNPISPRSGDAIRDLGLLIEHSKDCREQR